MKSVATVLLLAALSTASLAQPSDEPNNLKSSLLRFEAWTAKNSGVSVFSWPPLHGAIAQANELPEGKTSDAIGGLVTACQPDASLLCRKTFGKGIRDDKQRLQSTEDAMICLHNNFDRVSESCVGAAHQAVDQLSQDGLTTQESVLAALADKATQEVLKVCSFHDIKQCAAGESSDGAHKPAPSRGSWRVLKAAWKSKAASRKGGARMRAMRGDARPMLGKDGHGQPPAMHGGEHPKGARPMLGKDGHGQPPAMHGGEHPKGARPMHQRRVANVQDDVTREDAAVWYNAHTKLTDKDTAHLGSNIASAAQCLAESGGPMGSSQWFPNWHNAEEERNTAQVSEECARAAAHWSHLARSGAGVAAQIERVQDSHAEQEPSERDAWNTPLALANWGLKGVQQEEASQGGAPWEDIDVDFRDWDRRRFHRDHDDHDDPLEILLLFIVLPVLLCCGVRRCKQRRMQRQMAAAGVAAGTAPPPPARYNTAPTPQHAAAAAAASAASAPAVHYPFAAAQAPQQQPQQQRVQASLYPDAEQSSWNVSSWFNGAPSAPGYAPVSVRET